VYVKLADFGMAGFSGRDGRLKGRCGTPGYVAPDILKAGLNESYS
jgi:serine/threonine protein kinase